jgi:hypothetical protein
MDMLCGESECHCPPPDVDEVDVCIAGNPKPACETNCGDPDCVCA